MKTITLVYKKEQLELGFIHAQNILQGQADGRYKTEWQISKDSGYEFKDNGIIKRTNKRTDTDKAAPSKDPGGDKAPE